MVLSVSDHEKINWLEAFGVNNTNQTWIVGVPFSQKLQEEECFTLQNPDSGLFLTAIGPNELEIQGIQSKVCSVKKDTTFRNGPFTNICGHFIANYINIFHKIEVPTVIL